MAAKTQSNAKVEIEDAQFGAFAVKEFLPQLMEGNLVMVGVQFDCFALAAMCFAFLASVVIALEYCGSPSHVEFGLSHDFLLASFAMSVVVGVLPNPLRRSLGLSDNEFGSMEVMPRKESGNSSLAMHPRQDLDNSTAAAAAEMLALIIGYPLIYATVICATVIAGIWSSFRPSLHITQCLKFNKELLANWVNCWKPHSRERRAISSQAGSTLPEGSETTGAIQFA